MLVDSQSSPHSVIMSMGAKFGYSVDTTCRHNVCSTLDDDVLSHTAHMVHMNEIYGDITYLRVNERDAVKMTSHYRTGSWVHFT